MKSLGKVSTTASIESELRSLKAILGANVNIRVGIKVSDFDEAYNSFLFVVIIR